MKTTRLHLFAALFAFGSLVSLPAFELPVSKIPARIQANDTHVRTGTSRVMVALRLGTPNAVLPDGSWLFSGYNARHDGKELVRNGTLIVRFQANRVASLAIADRATVLALRQNPHPGAKDTLLTAANDRR